MPVKVLADLRRRLERLARRTSHLSPTVAIQLSERAFERSRL